MQIHYSELHTIEDMTKDIGLFINSDKNTCV